LHALVKATRSLRLKSSNRGVGIFLMPRFGDALGSSVLQISYVADALRWNGKKTGDQTTPPQE
jgi:hypothetical protein